MQGDVLNGERLACFYFFHIVVTDTSFINNHDHTGAYDFYFFTPADYYCYILTYPDAHNLVFNENCLCKTVDSASFRKNSIP